jgi:hypothetical protein
MERFLNRLAGALMLDANTFEEVEADRSATLQAMLVVVLSSLSAAVGVSGWRDDAGVWFFVGTACLSLSAWVTWAVLMYAVGALILPTPETKSDVGELLRTLGFAAAPGLLQAFAAVPGAGGGVFTICIVWTLAASVVAVRQALDFTSTARAIAVCVLGWGLALVFVLVIGEAFGPNLLGAAPSFISRAW